MDVSRFLRSGKSGKKQLVRTSTVFLESSCMLCLRRSIPSEGPNEKNEVSLYRSMRHSPTSVFVRPRVALHQEGRYYRRILRRKTVLENLNLCLTFPMDRDRKKKATDNMTNQVNTKTLGDTLHTHRDPLRSPALRNFPSPCRPCYNVPCLWYEVYALPNFVFFFACFFCTICGAFSSHAGAQSLCCLHI